MNQTCTTKAHPAWPLLLAALGWLARPVAAQTLTATSGASLTVQSGATLYVDGGLQTASGATLTNAGTVQLTGDLTNAGTLNSAGSLLFAGSQDQTFASGAATVAALTLNNTGTTGRNRLFIPANLTVSTTLTLTQGLVRTLGPGTGASLATLRLSSGGQVLGEGPGRYVQGRLQVERAVDGSSPVDFTNGLSLNAAGQNLGTVIVTRTAGLQQAGVSYGQNVGGTTKGIDRVWQVTAGQAPTAATSVTLRWVSDDDNGFNPGTAAQLWRAATAAGPWAPQGAAASASARSLTASLTQLGVLTVSNSSQPLPVTLVSFAAQRQGTDGLLTWATASELRNAYFVVESSADGRTFQRLGQVTGAGTSALAHSYQFIDANLGRYATPQVYYRLRQVDTDGTESYSPVRTVQVPLAAGLVVQAYPNPSAASAEVTLAIRTDQAGPATLLLFDAVGRQLGRQQLALSPGTTTQPLGLAQGLATGVYVLRVLQGGQQQVVKLVRE